MKADQFIKWPYEHLPEKQAFFVLGDKLFTRVRHVVKNKIFYYCFEDRKFYCVAYIMGLRTLEDMRKKLDIYEFKHTLLNGIKV